MSDPAEFRPGGHSTRPADQTARITNGGGEAVCFAAGASAAPFGAGVIHAYVASGREPPRIAAGISAGALSAAVMWSVFHEPFGPLPRGRHAAASLEAGQRRRFRRYVEFLTSRPLRVFWEGIPDLVDFYSDRPPLRDPATPPRLAGAEAQARFRRYRLVKLGSWMSGLPMKVSTLASLATDYVRSREHPRIMEREGSGFWAQCAELSRRIRMTAAGLFAALRLCVYSATTPSFIRMRFFKEIPSRLPIRPLMGWPIWLLSIGVAPFAALLALLTLAAPAWLVAETIARAVRALAISMPSRPGFVATVRDVLSRSGISAVDTLATRPALVALIMSVASWVIAALLWRHSTSDLRRSSRLGAAGRRLLAKVPGSRRSVPDGSRAARPTTLARCRRWLWRRIVVALGIERGLVTSFHLRVALEEIFRDHFSSDPQGPAVRLPPASERTSEPYPLIVAAPLESLRDASSNHPKVAYQIWARDGTLLLDGLQAALALPGVLDPAVVDKAHLSRWIRQRRVDGSPGSKVGEERLTLVDGAVVRANPIPALFDFLAEPGNGRLLRDSEKHPAIHVVHSVPIEPVSADAALAERDGDIVNVGLQSLRLSRHLDTRLEVQQFEFVSRLERMIVEAGGMPGRIIAFADEIAPTRELVFHNPLAPSREEVLADIASGCRRTLERLHARDLATLARAAQVGPDAQRVLCEQLCESLGRSLAPGQPPGLPEVCAACTHKLEITDRKPRPEFTSTPVRARPRIAVIASGGVFRGSFHIGMAAALAWARIRPDLIVGASVGTLMGCSIAKLFDVWPDDSGGPGAPQEACDLVEQLVTLFFEVDARVALTKQLKGAVREIGTRLRDVHLSPTDIRALFRRGTARDPAFAVLGAPPQLLDALSGVLLLPHTSTVHLASRFVAGDVTGAMGDLGTQLRRHTIGRLGIREAIMGTSLLRKEVRDILFAGGTLSSSLPTRHERQPFESSQLYCTTTNLAKQSMVILGSADLCPNAPYDIVAAALASSAFPAVFAPLRQSDVFPGRGRAEVRYGDGGMFDNLPFLPAIEVIAAWQRAELQSRTHDLGDALEALSDRRDRPDLIIVGALNVNPEERTFPENSHDSGERPEVLMDDIVNRARSLKDNVKIRAFQFASSRVANQVERLCDQHERDPERAESGLLTAQGRDAIRAIDSVVNSAVLPVFPADTEHLNGTFAFCRTLGLDHRRVARSIANGCFETLRTLAEAQGQPPQEDSPLARAARFTHRAVVALSSAKRIPALRPVATPYVGDGECPYFQAGDSAPFACPFAKSGTASKQVFETCVRDSCHEQRAGDLRRLVRQASSSRPAAVRTESARARPSR